MKSFTKWLSQHEIDTPPDRREPKKKVVLEPLPSSEIPKCHIKTLGLRQRDGKLQALYLLPNKTLVVNNGRRVRKIPSSKTLAFSRWLKTQGISLGEDTNWLVVGLENAAAYCINAEPALCLLHGQWPTESMPLEEFLAKYGGAE